MTLRPTLAALGALIIAALSAAGCVSMPSGGPVQSYPVSQQGADAQSQPFIQVQPPSPRPGWNPTQIVQGFLLASASFGTYDQVVNQYLTPQEQKTWKKETNWTAVVYKSGPKVSPPTYASTAKNSTGATVQVNGTQQASLKGSGSYSVPLPSGQGGAAAVSPAYEFQLQKTKDGQWRISQAPQVLLLTSNAFANDYQLRNLYFFDPAGKELVPDPIYVPLGATAEELVNGLVRDLITPPTDWLSTGKATKTAFPSDTKVSSVTLDGVSAVVNLTGTITKASNLVMGQIWAQLSSTLQGGPNGQAVQSVEILRNGKAWVPPESQGNPAQPNYHPANGGSAEFYYVDKAGYLYSRAGTLDKPPTKLARIGTGYTQLAVSADGKYVAALQGSSNSPYTLYAGPIGRKLTKLGTGYMAMSWDKNDDLWASVGNGIVMFRGSGGQPLGQRVPVTVTSTSYVPTPPYTLLKVAPDGVRVAIVQGGGTTLTFGAISGQQGDNPRISLSTVQNTAQTLTPSIAVASFTALAWYDADNVITLSGPGSPAVTEYPVSGGNSTPIPTDSGMESITVSYKQPLIAGLSNGQMASDVNPTGSWTAIDDVDGTPTDGIAPTYPG
jgi:hypothetical protein